MNELPWEIKDKKRALSAPRQRKRKMLLQQSIKSQLSPRICLFVIVTVTNTKEGGHVFSCSSLSLFFFVCFIPGYVVTDFVIYHYLHVIRNQLKFIQFEISSLNRARGCIRSRRTAYRYFINIHNILSNPVRQLHGNFRVKLPSRSKLTNLKNSSHSMEKKQQKNKKKTL